MKTLFTILSIFISTVISSQALDCIDNLSVAVNIKEGVKIFAVDVLTVHENINPDDFSISIDSGDFGPFAYLTKDDIGSHSYELKNTITGAVCQGMIEVGESVPSSIIAVCIDKIIVDLETQTTVTIDDIDDGTFSSSGTEDLSFSLSLGDKEFYKPGSPNFEFADKIDFAGLEVCSPPIKVFLNVWDNEGHSNACWTTVLIDVPGLDCDLNLESGHDNSFSVAVCESNVTFNYSESNTQINIDDIDAGSNLDSEGLFASLSFEPTPTTSPLDNNFQSIESLEFTSSDVCEIVFVFLHIWDTTGNLNSCWTEVKVKGAEDCNFEESTVCGHKCADGKLFDPYSIKWPLSYDESEIQAYQRDCKGLTQTEMKSSGKLECDADLIKAVPTWCEAACSLVGYSYEDKVGEKQDASCVNIERSWVIIDWCTYDPKSETSISNQDSFGFIEELKDNECTSCGDSNSYVGYVQVEADGYYAYEQKINFTESTGLVEDELPVAIDQINGDFDMSSFGFEINGARLVLKENGTFSIPESALKEGTNKLSLKTLPASNVLNGVSTLDLVLGLQYIIGLRELTPEQIIAADIDKSGDVSVARDLIQLRNLILGNTSDIVGEHWFVIPQNQDFSSFNGFGFENNFSTYSFQKDDLDMEKGLTLSIYKYGDLNESHSYTRSGEKAALHFDNRKLTKGDEFSVLLTLSADQIGKFIAAQAGLVFKGLNLKDVKHEYGKEFDFSKIDNSLKFIYNDNEKPLSQLKLELIFESLATGELSDFMKLDETFTTEYITTDLNLFDIELISGDLSSPGSLVPSTVFSEITNISIYPNPTSGSFMIAGSPALIGKTVHIYNSLGQLEYSQKVVQVNTEIVTDNLTSGLKVVALDDVKSEKIMIKR